MSMIARRLSAAERRHLRMLDEINPLFTWKVDLFAIIDAVARWEQYNGEICGVVDFEVIVA